MIVYTTPHTVRVEIGPNVYCLIVTGASDLKSFYLINDTHGDPVFMFTCKTESDTESATLAKTNAILYIPDTW